VPQQAQQQPQAADTFAATVRECEAKLRAKFPGASEADISAQAEINAILLEETRATIRQELTSQTRNDRFEAMVKNTPELQTPLANYVFEQANQSGLPFRTPQEHLNAVHAEMFRRGIPMAQPQAGGTQAVAGAMAQAQQGGRLFQNVNGGAVAPQSNGVMSDTVRRQVEFAEKQGMTGEALERIKARAIQNEAARR
jgi:hypothetical protein